VSKNNDQIRERVEAFVKDLETLIREAAVAAVAAALGVEADAVHGLPAPKKASPAPNAAKKTAAKKAAKKAAPKAAKKAAPKAAKGGKRIRRSAKEIGAMGQKISDYIAKNPGQRAEQIKKALKLSDTDWALPIKKLVDEKKLSVKGQKRATTYFVAKA
jgi:hypothetical protein